MFPNNMDFFVEERLKERYAEAEQYRLGKPAMGQRLGRVKRILITAVSWVSRLRQSSFEPLQVHPTLQPINDMAPLDFEGIKATLVPDEDMFLYGAESAEG